MLGPDSCFRRRVGTFNFESRWEQAPELEEFTTSVDRMNTPPGMTGYATFNSGGRVVVLPAATFELTRSRIDSLWSDFIRPN